MGSWRKAITFTVCFMGLCYLGGAMVMLGAHQSAKMIGVIDHQNHLACNRLFLS